MWPCGSGNFVLGIVGTTAKTYKKAKAEICNEPHWFSILRLE
jgi:hypothetical protein